jgi:hypothetical protein
MHMLSARIIASRPKMQQQAFTLRTQLFCLL